MRPFLPLRAPLLPPLLALAAFLGAGPASAATIPAPAPPALAHAGRSYATAIPGMPAGVREVELFLAPEDGSGRLIRLTAERDGREGVLRWRMPALAVARARLVLRAGEDGHEWQSAPSAAFEVAAPGGGELALLLRGESESGWRIAGGASPMAGITIPADATTIGWATALLHAAEESHSPGVVVPGRMTVRDPARHSDPPRRASARATTSFPTYRPLLI